MAVLVVAAFSMIGKLMKAKGGEQPPANRPKWPGPVAGPGWPGQGQGQNSPWPQRTPQGRPSPPPWPPQGQQPAQHSLPEVQPMGEGISMEGRRTEGYGSIEAARMEGTSSMVTGGLAEEQARFRQESDQFRRNTPATALHRRQKEPVAAVPVAQVTPLVEALKRPEGLAQAVLVSEILGKPRALRPFWRK